VVAVWCAMGSPVMAAPERKAEPIFKELGHLLSAGHLPVLFDQQKVRAVRVAEEVQKNFQFLIERSKAEPKKYGALLEDLLNLYAALQSDRLRTMNYYDIKLIRQQIVVYSRKLRAQRNLFVRRGSADELLVVDAVLTINDGMIRLLQPSGFVKGTLFQRAVGEWKTMSWGGRMKVIGSVLLACAVIAVVVVAVQRMLGKKDVVKLERRGGGNVPKIKVNTDSHEGDDDQLTTQFLSTGKSSAGVYVDDEKDDESDDGDESGESDDGDESGESDDGDESGESDESDGERELPLSPSPDASGNSEL